MSAGLNRDEYLELRRDSRPDDYPKSTQAVVQELTDRGYKVDATVLNYLVKTGKVRPGRVGMRNLAWTIDDVEAVVVALEEQESYLPLVVAARCLRFSFSDYLRALKTAVATLRTETRDESIGEDSTMFVMQVHPARFGKPAQVTFEVCDDVRRHLGIAHSRREPLDSAPAEKEDGHRAGNRKKRESAGAAGARSGGAPVGAGHRSRNGMAFSAE